MTTKIPAELSSTPGIADSSNATAITIDSSEQVGIGTTAPNDYDNNSAGISSNLVVKDSGHAGIIVISGVSSDAAIAFGDGTGTDAYRGAVAYVNSADALYFKAGGNNKLRLDSDGLKFGTDTAAANALDDYEEGEHNPTITAGSGTPSIASAEDTLSYTKIGNKVFINGQLGACSASGCSGTLSLTMPFACAAQSERADFYFGTASTNNNDVVMFVLTNTANTNVFTIAVIEEDGTKNTSSAAFMSTKSPFDMNFTGFHYTTT